MVCWNATLTADFDDWVEADSNELADAALQDCLPRDVLDALDVLENSDRVDLSWRFERVDFAEIRADDAPKRGEEE